MNKTQIEWVKNPDGTQGYTLNPITGCLNHINGMCNGGGFPCYAHRLANGRLKHLYLANENLAGGYRLARGILNENVIPPSQDPFYPRFWPERLKELKPIFAGKTEKSKGIFPCDMSDLFGIGIPYEWTEAIMNVIKTNWQHRFYLLTKQPQNLPQWSPFPDNCWVGVTVCTNGMMTQAFYGLSRIKAGKTFISFEPLLGLIGKNDHVPLKSAWLDWLIIGAQTKPYKPPKIEWIEEIVKAADKAGVPVFLKDNLSPLLEPEETHREAGLFYETNRRVYKLRQELP